jgi:hypothetical protein
MTKRNLYSTCLSLITLFFAINITQPLLAQTSEVNVTGVVTESGTGLPLKQVSISVSSTGVTAGTDENGAFTIVVPSLEAELTINLPGYNVRNIYLNGRDKVNVTLVSASYRSFDNSYNTPNGAIPVKDAIYSVTSVTASDVKLNKVTSFDQVFQGRVPGMSVTQQSGMPGSRTYMTVRGISSLYGNSEPLLVIDGMIHDYSYASSSLMEGFALNPMDVVDIDDISDISVLKDGLSYFGAAGSNGVVNVNTEQKAETSTVMKFSAYGGITMAPKKQDLLDAAEFKNYFGDMLNSQGLSSGEINTMYPWLNGEFLNLKIITNTTTAPIGRMILIHLLLYQNFTSSLKGVMILLLITFLPVICLIKEFTITQHTPDIICVLTVKSISPINSQLYLMQNYRLQTVNWLTRGQVHGKIRCLQQH